MKGRKIKIKKKKKNREEEEEAEEEEDNKEEGKKQKWRDQPSQQATFIIWTQACD